MWGGYIPICVEFGTVEVILTHFTAKKRRPLLYGKTLSRRKLYIKLYLYPRIDVKFIYKQAVSVGEIYNLKLCRLTSNFVNKVQYGLSLLGKNYGKYIQC